MISTIQIQSFQHNSSNEDKNLYINLFDLRKNRNKIFPPKPLNTKSEQYYHHEQLWLEKRGEEEKIHRIEMDELDKSIKLLKEELEIDEENNRKEKSDEITKINKIAKRKKDKETVKTKKVRKQWQTMRKNHRRKR